MMNASKPNEDLTAPIRDPRGDRSPADPTGTPPVVWSPASRTASLAAPAATFGVRQEATLRATASAERSGQGTSEGNRLATGKQ